MKEKYQLRTWKAIGNAIGAVIVFAGFYGMLYLYLLVTAPK